MAESAHMLTVRLPAHLSSRAVRLAKRWQSNLTQLLREGLALRVEQLEAKEREEQERALREQEAKRNRRVVSLAPKPLINNLDEARTVLNNRPDEVYIEQAKKIVAALDDDTKRDTAVADAVATIKRRYPITHPGDETIKTKLEEIIVEMIRGGEEAPKPPPPSMAELSQHLRTMREEVRAIAAPQPQMPPLAITKPRRVNDEAVGKTINPARVKSRGDV